MKLYRPDISDRFSVLNPVSVFLAGSIEMGIAEDWQKVVIEKIAEFEKNLKLVHIFNPRREDWDSSWNQEQKSLEFNKQVNWELRHLEEANIVFMYFDPNTKSPISLLELGLLSQSEKLIVCCPEGFWRKGNVEIVCTRYNIPLFSTLEDGVGALLTKIQTYM
jgi:hypothetical protein